MQTSKGYRAVCPYFLVAAIGISAVLIGSSIGKQEHVYGDLTADPTGEKIVPFRATKVDGTVVNFPGDYKDKIVMLDFWATWCRPCMNELPNLVKTYKRVHSKGLEVLGISLDGPDSVDRVGSVIAEYGMTWPQVHDGKSGRAAIAELYDIQSIPAAFLVDGDTGEILARGDSLREPNLAPTIERILAKRVKKKG